MQIHLHGLQSLWALVCCMTSLSPFYYLKRGDNNAFPVLLTHGIELISEILCGKELAKLKCALQILCMQLLSLAPYLFIKIEHTRDKKRKCKNPEKKGTSAFLTDHPWIIITRGSEELKPHCCNVSGWLSRIWQPLSGSSSKSRNLVSVSCNVSIVSTAWDLFPNGSGI